MENEFESLRVNNTDGQHFWRQYTLYTVVERSRSEISEDRSCFDGSNHHRVKWEVSSLLIRASQRRSQIFVFGKSPFQGIFVFSSQLSKQVSEVYIVHLGRSRQLS